MAKSEERPGEGERGGRPRRPHLSTPAWSVETVAAEVAALHALGLGDGDSVRRLIRLCRPTDAVLVLGSTQVAPPAGALPIVRRRGGGGAVIVRPAALVWIDVVLPRDDPLWDDDVARAFLWLGDAWAATLEALGVSGTSVHTGAAVCTPLCRSVCFGGLGSGEVTVDGVKAVGMSQRRTRAGAVFQSCLLREWDPAAYVEVLDLPAEGGPALAEAAIAFTDLSVDAVESAFLATLRQ